VTESILQEAQRLIHGERNKNYGHPRENFADIAVLFTAYLDKEIDEIDVANLMILVKVARVKGTGYHRDSYTDIAGYAGCVERIYEEPVEKFGYETQVYDEELADWEKDLLAAAKEDFPKTMVYYSLVDVPEEIVVYDRDGVAWGSERHTGATSNDGFVPFYVEHPTKGSA